MKKMIKMSLFIAAFLLAYFITPAQESAIPKWVSEKGYWVLEGNVHTPLNNIIRFYNNDDVLVYTENLKGVKLNTNKRKVKMKLKQALETAIMAWEGKKEKMEELALVKNSL
ncbi:MAG: hypothetical protein ACTHMV_12980 [Chitinophagaceae bacterium]